MLNHGPKQVSVIIYVGHVGVKSLVQAAYKRLIFGHYIRCVILPLISFSYYY